MTAADEAGRPSSHKRRPAIDIDKLRESLSEPVEGESVPEVASTAEEAAPVDLAALREQLKAELRKELEAEMASVQGTNEGEPIFADVDPADPDVHVIHFVDDGLSALGKVWCKGEELSVKEGTPEWDLLHDRNGDTWLFYTEDQQIDHWGKRMFREGPWQGKGFDLDDPNLSDEDREKLRRAQAKLLRNRMPERSLLK